MRVAPKIVLTNEERAELTKRVRSKLTSVRLVQRARIVLLAAQGMQSKDIAAELGIGRAQVSRWRERYAESRLSGIERDLPRGAPPMKVDVARLVELTTQGKPEAATHWSTRTMAAELGVSAASVSRHWRENGLKPHLVRGFKVSRDPQFVEKLEDIVGLYLSPPEHALVLCCDEKSQVQALDRTQPGLPLKKGRAATMTHDYKRNGTTTLFAALNVLDGQVIGQCQQRHTPHRVAEVPQADRPRDTQGQDAASDRRQLRHAQAPDRAGVAEQASALQHALHAHLGVVAEHGRALLPRHHRQAAAPRRVHQRAGVGHRH